MPLDQSSNLSHKTEHAAAFFDTSDELCLSVVNFIEEGIRQGEKVIIIYGENHLTQIEGALKARTIDLDKVRSTGQYSSHNASVVISIIFKNGSIDKKSAQSLIKDSLSEGVDKFSRIRLSGEIVSLLWKLGNVDATLSLEDLWNEALTKYPAKLYCPYLNHDVSELVKRSDRLKICRTHDTIIPTKSFTQFSDFEFLQELVLTLEQKNRRLECEILARTEYENSLDNLIKERDDFISIIGHELRTPLTSFTLQTQMISKFLNEIEIPNEIRLKLSRSLEICGLESSRMKHLIGSILDNTKLKLGTFVLDRSYFSLANLVSEIVSRFNIQYNNRKQVDIVSSCLVTGYWDHVRIEQVLINLISNAIKYGQGKPVEISVETDQAGSVGILKVKDRGIGIRPEDREKIFNKYERSCDQGEYSGLGLGLYLVKQIVDAHRGKITVESAPEAGCEFRVELPTVSDLATENRIPLIPRQRPCPNL